MPGEREVVSDKIPVWTVECDGDGPTCDDLRDALVEAGAMLQQAEELDDDSVQVMISRRTMTQAEFDALPEWEG